MTAPAAALAAFAAGILLTAAAARWLLARHIARLRAAEQRARASERLAELGSMTGGLAHEIKNPLSTIQLNLQLLREDLPEGEPFSTRIVNRLTKTLPGESAVFIHLNVYDDVFPHVSFCSFIKWIDEIHHVESPLTKG